MDLPTTNSTQNTEFLTQFKTLVEIVAKLRGPDGCPWDKAQTQKSLTQYAIEEAFELVEAIELGTPEDVKEELGDFLFQVILQAQVAQDEGLYSLGDVIKLINHKLIERHPHVFSDTKVSGVEEVWSNWEKIKKAEKERKGLNKKLFSYPIQLPALQAAHKIGVKTQGYKFDWDNADEVLVKVEEELNELKEALQSQDISQIQHEIGDLLFSLAQLARHKNLESEQILRATNRRFEERFSKVLELSGKSKEEFTAIARNQKEELWQKAKALLKT